jgi:uncharacterized cofD-like protein
LLALAGSGPREKVWADALDYRFSDRSGELAGHSLGNLVLVALSQTMGDFVTATAELAHLLGVTARILPATSEAVALCAEIEGGGVTEVDGQANVAHSAAPIRRVWLRPPDPMAPAEVLAAIASADQVVLGPGSLFTSVLAVCAVPGIRQALAERDGGRVYVCNLRPQDPETAGYDADAHLAALAAHGVAIDAILCDPSTTVGVPGPAAGGAEPGPRAVRVVAAPVAGPSGHSHDPALLADVLSRLASPDGAGPG